MSGVQTLKNTMKTDTGASGQQTIIGLMKKHKAQIERALPKHMNADRMLRIVTTELRNTPKLGECDPISLFGAVIQCSQLGLEPGGVLGHAYLIPYGKKAQLIIGYRGLIDLARRSGQIVSITANAVYKEDHFEFEFGLNPTLSHRPDFEGRDWSDKPVYVYAVAELKDGGKQFVIMHRIEVERLRQRNGNKSFSIWQTDYEEMAKKTAIRRLFKLLPVSIELAKAITLGDAENGRQEFTMDGEFIEIQPEQEDQDENNRKENGEVNAISQ